jgi:hypothetical protein
VKKLKLSATPSNSSKTRSKKITRGKESTGVTSSKRKKTVSNRRQSRRRPRFLSLKQRQPASRMVRTSLTTQSSRSVA